MLIIDGASGEGGGQILRTALAAVTRQPFRIEGAMNQAVPRAIASAHELELFVTTANANSVGQEVSAIERKDLPRVECLGGSNERPIRQVHGMIAVLPHQRKRPPHRRDVEEPNQQPLSKDKLAKIVRASTIRLYHVKGLGENRNGRVERA
jgi:hypothetical protein